MSPDELEARKTQMEREMYYEENAEVARQKRKEIHFQLQGKNLPSKNQQDMYDSYATLDRSSAAFLRVT